MSVLVVGANSYLDHTQGQFICLKLMSDGILIEGTICRGPSLEPLGMVSVFGGDDGTEVHSQQKFKRVYKYDSLLDDPCSILDGSPSVIVYVAGMTDSGACEKNEALAIQTNTPTALINEAARRNILFIFISTDLGMFNVMSTFTAVFDGLDAPYKEDAKTHPLSAYSRSKLSGETAVKAANGRYVIVRCALMLGPPPVIPGTNSCRIGFITNGVKNPPLKLFTDEYRTPVHVKDIANLISVITAQRDHIGNQIIHMGGPESVSKYTMGCMMVDAMNLDPSRTVVPSKMSDVNVGFPRPPNVTLDSSVAHGMIKPTPLIDAIRDSVKHLAK